MLLGCEDPAYQEMSSGRTEEEIGLITARWTLREIMKAGMEKEGVSHGFGGILSRG